MLDPTAANVITALSSLGQNPTHVQVTPRICPHCHRRWTTVFNYEWRRGFKVEYVEHPAGTPNYHSPIGEHNLYWLRLFGPYWDDNGVEIPEGQQVSIKLPYDGKVPKDLRGFRAYCGGQSHRCMRSQPVRVEMVYPT